MGKGRLSVKEGKKHFEQQGREKGGTKLLLQQQEEKRTHSSVKKTLGKETAFEPFGKRKGGVESSTCLLLSAAMKRCEGGKEKPGISSFSLGRREHEFNTPEERTLHFFAGVFFQGKKKKRKLLPIERG